MGAKGRFRAHSRERKTRATKPGTNRTSLQTRKHTHTHIRFDIFVEKCANWQNDEIGIQRSRRSFFRGRSLPKPATACPSGKLVRRFSAHGSTYQYAQFNAQWWHFPPTEKGCKKTPIELQSRPQGCTNAFDIMVRCFVSINECFVPCCM